MRGGIVLEFSGRKEFWPASGIVGTKYLKIGFDFLIGSFGLSVGLWVIGGGESDVVLEESSEFSSQGRGELRASIQYNSIMESKPLKDILEKESPYFYGINGF